MQNSFIIKYNNTHYRRSGLYVKNSIIYPREDLVKKKTPARKVFVAHVWLSWTMHIS